jgi:hypothetical protein
LLAGCIGSASGSASGSGTILKMVVQVGMLLTLLFTANGGSPRMRGAEVGFPGGFGTNCAQRDELLQILLLAGRAFRCGRRMQHQVFELMSALPAFVFKDWHE